MKRSQINHLQRQAVAFFADHRFRLPPFASWTPQQWRDVGPELDEIRRCHLGWDLTDFGSGDFPSVGLLLFTLRNGDVHDEANDKAYAEKIMIVDAGQVTPWHYHAIKMEDIINRGGGNLVVELRDTDELGGFTDTAMDVCVDGRSLHVVSGGRVTLTPGESITLHRGMAHQFFGEDGKVLVGEVSSVNDDGTDNYFIPPTGRFPTIEEDETPLYLLCNDYPQAESR